MSDDVIAHFNELKLKRIAAKYVTYVITAGKVVLSESGESADFNEFMALLPENEGRFALYDKDFSTNDGRPATKLILISW